MIAVLLAIYLTNCGVTVQHDGGQWVEIHDVTGAWQTFDAPGGEVEIAFDAPTRTRLADGWYQAIWDDGFHESFLIACAKPTLPPTDTAESPRVSLGENAVILAMFFGGFVLLLALGEILLRGLLFLADRRKRDRDV